MKSSYPLKEDGIEARWFEETSNKEKAIIWMHGSGMNEKKYHQEANRQEFNQAFNDMQKKRRERP